MSSATSCYILTLSPILKERHYCIVHTVYSRPYTPVMVISYIWMVIVQLISETGFELLSFAFSYPCSRCRTSASATTAAGWWSVHFEVPLMSFPSIRTVERHVHARTCLHVWSIAWAVSRRVPDWRRSSKSWAANRAAGVAPFLASLVAHLDPHYMVSNPIFFFFWKYYAPLTLLQSFIS